VVEAGAGADEAAPSVEAGFFSVAVEAELSGSLEMAVSVEAAPPFPA
jgi:hypothetical protein